MLALSTTLPCSRQTEPLIVGLRSPPPKLFFLLPSLGIVVFAAPFKRILFSLSDPSLESHGTKVAFIFWNLKSCISYFLCSLFYLIINVIHTSCSLLKLRTNPFNICCNINIYKCLICMIIFEVILEIQYFISLYWRFLLFL